MIVMKNKMTSHVDIMINFQSENKHAFACSLAIFYVYQYQWIGFSTCLLFCEWDYLYIFSDYSFIRHFFWFISVRRLLIWRPSMGLSKIGTSPIGRRWEEATTTNGASTCHLLEIFTRHNLTTIYSGCWIILTLLLLLQMLGFQLTV